MEQDLYPPMDDLGYYHFGLPMRCLNLVDGEWFKEAEKEIYEDE